MSLFRKMTFRPGDSNTGASRVKKKVLFLCTGNSCRSQLAEALVTARLNDGWQAYSAGTHPSGTVHPGAIQALKEIGIDWQGQSKSIDAIRSIPFDLVVTVCDSAAEECPLWLGAGRRFHLGYPDPARVQGTDEQVLEAVREVRDAMLQEIPALLRGGKIERTEE